MSLDKTGNLKLSKNDSIKESINKLSEGKLEVMFFLQAMNVRYINETSRVICYINLLDILGVYGSHIIYLYENICNEDWSLFEKTMNAVGEAKLSKKDIHSNLNSNNPKPFEI